MPDMDGDGTDDIALADCTEQVCIVSGRTGELLRNLPIYVGENGALEVVGDLDGNGTLDLFLYKGWAVMKDWPADGPSTRAIEIVSVDDGRVLASPAESPHAGGVHSPGDVDGDGVPDIAFSGRTLRILSGMDGRLLRELAGEAGGGRGDWNGDGCADLLVVHNLEFWDPKEVPPNLWRKGRVEIVSGKDGTVLKTYDESVLPPVE
jgi:hypothetical protein